MRASFYAGVTQKPELKYTVTGQEERYQKMALLQEYGSYNNLATIPQIITDSLNPAYNGATDWQDLFYKSGIIKNADVSISAGSDLLNYRLGVNYYNEDGIVRNTGFKRYSMRGNFDFKITPKFNTALSFSLSKLDRKRGLGRGRNDIVPISASSQPSSFYTLTQTDYDFYYGQYDKLRDKNESDILNLSVQSNYTFFPGLEYSFRAGVGRTTEKRERFQPKEIGPEGRSFASNNNSQFTQYYVANTVSYGKSFVEKKHNLGVVLTQSFDFKDVTNAVVGGYNIPSDNIQVVSGVPQQDLFGYSDFKQSGLLSFLGQVSYDFKEKYIINASWRADGSSRFGENSKWGYFPSVSLAWLASEESFLAKTSWINLLKFRASYGLSGTEPDDFYAPYNVWASGETTYNGVPTSTPSFEKPITLKNLTWNKANQLNVGVDLYAFKNKINLSVDLYRRENFNPIQSFDFPFFTGYERLKYNAPLGILNEGIDVQLKTRNLPSGRDFQWDTWFNLNYNKNRISKLPNDNRTFYADSRGYNQRLIYQVGQPIYTWAQMIYTGV